MQQIIHTDETMRETVLHGTKDYPFKYYLENIYDFDLHCMNWHWHSELEFVYVVSGQATVYAGAQKYKVAPGQGIFINSQVIHRFEATESTVIPNIVFSPSLLAPPDSLIYKRYVEPVLESNIECCVFNSEISWNKDALNFLQNIFHEQEKEESCELRTVNYLFDLWTVLYENIEKASLNTSNSANARDRGRLQIVLQYIHDNYQSELNLDELAKKIAVSKSSLLTLFNSYVHISPIEYVVHYRLSQAAILLENTENTIQQIAFTTGFNNEGYFCRKFKEVYKCTPGFYRKKKR